MNSISDAAVDLIDLDNTADNTAIARSAALLKALANEKRLQIIYLLRDQEMSVSQLNDHLALSQSALSQHLAILRREALVSTRRKSQTIYYSLDSSSAEAIVDALGAHV